VPRTAVPAPQPAAGSLPAPIVATSGRYDALDRLRGLIIVLMAIDHASYFIAKVHPGEFWGVPLPEHASAAAFLTRFVTHLAAPGFFFLMGASIVFLATARRSVGWSDGRIARHLVGRGLLLIVLQHLVENPAWLLGGIGAEPVLSPVPGGGGEVWLHFGVLYGLGAAMIVCAALLAVPAPLLAGLGAGAILLTQALTPPAAQADALYAPVARLLLVPGQTGAWQVYYPLLPWLGVAMLGMAFGRAMQRDAAAVLRRAWLVGLACLAAFGALRAVGLGDHHAPEAAGWIAFLNLTKYPPSAAFLLLTLGLNLVLLTALQRAPDRRLGGDSPLLVFGQSALAFYLLHLYVYGVAGLLFPRGVSLPVMYALWAAGLALLYVLCRRYRAFKRRTRADSVWRLF
jgi:uncharacterized membrane protein